MKIWHCSMMLTDPPLVFFGYTRDYRSLVKAVDATIAKITVDTNGELEGIVYDDDRSLISLLVVQIESEEETESLTVKASGLPHGFQVLGTNIADVTRSFFEMAAAFEVIDLPQATIEVMEIVADLGLHQRDDPRD